MAFVQEKSAQAFRTISEVAEVLDTPAHVLRFWESKFTQIKPVKRGGGRRYYRPQDIDLLRGIRDLLYDQGLTIKGVQKVLRERGVRHVIDLGAGVEAAPAPSVQEVAPAALVQDAAPAAVADTPAPAPKPPSKAPSYAPPPVHPDQMSLFDAPTDPVPEPAHDATPAGLSHDKRAELTQLYTALSALRDRMKAART
ncbi:MAG: MerR family transcriptional regulator [Pseudomonadota bacterium]